MDKDTTTAASELAPYKKTQELMRKLVTVPKKELGKDALTTKKAAESCPDSEQGQRRTKQI